MCSVSARSLTKGEFLKVYLVIFLFPFIETMCANPSYPVILFGNVAGELILFRLISDRGGVPLSRCFQ